MPGHYPTEKFSDATRTLAMGRESIQKRVAAAFEYSLVHLTAIPSVPANVAQKLQDFGDAWDAIGDTGGRGQISVWVSGLTDDEAVEIAGWIVETAWELERQYWTRPTPQPTGQRVAGHPAFAETLVDPPQPPGGSP